MCVFSAVAELSGSVSIQKLLEYLENDGKDANYRPILWVALLFIGRSAMLCRLMSGPTIGSVAIQFYIFLSKST